MSSLKLAACGLGRESASLICQTAEHAHPRRAAAQPCSPRPSLQPPLLHTSGSQANRCPWEGQDSPRPLCSPQRRIRTPPPPSVILHCCEAHHAMGNPHGGPRCSPRPADPGTRPSSALLNWRRRVEGWGPGEGDNTCRPEPCNRTRRLKPQLKGEGRCMNSLGDWCWVPPPRTREAPAAPSPPHPPQPSSTGPATQPPQPPQLPARGVHSQGCRMPHLHLRQGMVTGPAFPGEAHEQGGKEQQPWSLQDGQQSWPSG